MPSAPTFVLALGLGAIVLAGCTAKTHSVTTTETVRSTTTRTSTPARPTPVPYTPPAPSAVAPLGSAKAPMPAGEVEQTCPYISNKDMEDAEGDHVYRTSVITTTTPHGCRFYFYAAPFQAIADIVPMTFASPTEAFNAMVATAGPSAQPVTDLIAGVTAELFQTAFNPSDGNRDWACVFAKGNVMVVVHTQQTDVSFNARAIAALIAPKF